MRHKGAIIIRWAMVLPLVTAVLFLGSKTVRIPSSSPKHPREPRRELRRSSSLIPRLALLNNETQSIVSEAQSDKQNALDRLTELREEISQELENQEVRVFGKDLPEIALDRAKAFSAMIKRRLAWMEEKLQEGSLSEVEDSVTIWTAERVPVPLGADVPCIRLIEEKHCEPDLSGGILKPPAPSRGDTSETLEIEFTDMLQARAALLGHDVRRILGYVRNTTAYECYYGSLKGSEETLLSGGGNDVDQASLLMALLRISEIPCRYVKGVLELDTEEVKEWLGVVTALAARRVLVTAGVPHICIAGDGPGGYSHFLVEHVWVVAHVPVQNYRGIPGDERGKIWVPMAPAIKKMEASGSLNVMGEMTFDAEAFFDAYIESLETRNPMDVFEDSVSSYLAGAHPGVGLDAVKRTFEIAQEDYPILPLSLPGKIVTVHGEHAECPGDWRVVLELRAHSGSDTLLSMEVPVAQVGTRRMILSFKPETEADALILLECGGIYETPAYLVRVTPVVRLGGETIAMGSGGIGLGQEYCVDFLIRGPKGPMVERTKARTAGTEWAVSVVSWRVPGMVYREARGVGDAEAVQGRELHEVIMWYWEAAGRALERFGELWWMRVMREPEMTVCSTELRITGAFGQPVDLDWAGLHIDAHGAVNFVELCEVVEDIGKVLDGFTFTAGAAVSWLEHKVFESRYGVKAISTVLALERALEQGVGIYELDSTNVEEQLGLMDLPGWAEYMIRCKTNSGHEVKAPGGLVSQDDWEGIGCVYWSNMGTDYILQGSLGGGVTTAYADSMVWWHRWLWFEECVVDWLRYYPDIDWPPPGYPPIEPDCFITRTETEWLYPPDSSVWACGDTIPIVRKDIMYWSGAPVDSVVLGPDTAYMYTKDYGPDLHVIRPQVWHLWGPAWESNDDSLSIWVVKVEVDEELSDRILDVPVAEGDSAEVPVRTVFRVRPDSIFLEAGPGADTTKVEFYHYVTRGTEETVIDTVKSKKKFNVHSLATIGSEGDDRWKYILEWEQKDDEGEWFPISQDPDSAKVKSHIMMRWETEDEETRESIWKKIVDFVEALVQGVGLVVLLPDGNVLPEVSEQSPGCGMVVDLNDDYDGDPDGEILDRDKEGTVPDEDDLVELAFNLAVPGPEGWTVELELMEEGDQDGKESVRVWRSKHKGDISQDLILGPLSESSGRWSYSWNMHTGDPLTTEGPSITLQDIQIHDLWVEGYGQEDMQTNVEANERLRDWALVLRVRTGQSAIVIEDVVEGTVIRWDLDVDTDRSGSVDGDAADREDEPGEDNWTTDRGAIFAVNCDRDGNNSTPGGEPRPDAIHFKDDGTTEYEDYFINKGADGNSDDEADIAPLVIRRIVPGIPTGCSVFLKAAETEDVKRVHVFHRIEANEEESFHILGSVGGTGTPEEVDVTEYVDPESSEFEGDLEHDYDSTFGIEGLFFRYVGNDAPEHLGFDGEIDLSLELRLGDRLLVSDAVRLRVAPWIALSREQASEKIYAADYAEYGSGNTAFLQGLGVSGQLVPIPPSHIGSEFLQDHIEIGYTQMPGGPETHVVFRLPYDHPELSENPTWPVFSLLGQDRGVFQIGRDVGTGETNGQNHGGNLEVLPADATHKPGRIVMGKKDNLVEIGENPSPAFRQFIESQEVQDPFFEVPIHWLWVAHIDEIVSFLSDGKVVIADPRKGWDLLKNEIRGEDRGKSLFFDVKGEHKPVAGEITADSNTNGTFLHVDEDYTGQTWWKYVRIYDGDAKGTVAEIAVGGLGDHVITIEKVWYTGWKIINAALPDHSIFHYAHALTEEYILWSNWDENPPQDGDKYVLCEGTLFWKKGTPAIVTVKEVIDDDDFKNLNRNEMHERINGGGAGSVQNIVRSLGSSDQPLTFLKSSSLFFGVPGVAGDEPWRVIGTAFNPASANLQVVAGKLYVPKQNGPLKDDADLFEAEIRNVLGSNVEFVDDWFYHPNKGSVHCASSVKRKLDAVGPWWENPPAAGE